jgi:mannose-6-phosphate isomerase-like protein (cupin superfamily)
MQIMTLDGEPHATVWNRYLRADFATWPVGQDCQVHSHKDAIEIFVFLEGECEITVGDEVQVVRAGQAVYVGPNVRHRLKAIGDRPMKMFLFVSPNHEPTHTLLEADGTTRDTNRPPPGPEIRWLGQGDD